jgi:hypothetical protein
VTSYGDSPLLDAVDDLLRAAEVREAEIARRALVARERRDRVLAEQREQVERERRAQEEALRLQQEVAARLRVEAEQADAKAAERRVIASRRFLKILATTSIVAFVAYGILIASSFFDQRRTAAVGQAATSARRAEHLAFTEIYLQHESRELRVASSETLFGLLTRAGVSSGEAQGAVAAVARVYNLNRMRPGHPVSLYFERKGAVAELRGISFRSATDSSIIVTRALSGGFEAHEMSMTITFEIARIAAPVQTSLYATALNLGATDREVAAFVDAFSYDDSILRDMSASDQFELVFERYYDDQGNTVRTGDLLFVAMGTASGRLGYYQFLAPGDVRSDWYNIRGWSPRREVSLSGEALRLFRIEQQRIDALRQVRARETNARLVHSQR